MMIDEKLARLRAHRNNISRYNRLLRTELTELERRFIEKRVSEERIGMEALAVSTFPISFQFPLPAMEQQLSQRNDRHDLIDAWKSRHGTEGALRGRPLCVSPVRRWLPC